METLKIKVGARVVLIFNISISDSLVNGATGKILDIKFQDDSENSEVKFIVAKFDDPKVGKEQRKSFGHLCPEWESELGTPIFPTRMDCFPKSRSDKEHGNRCTIIQFAFRLGWASTAHKLQGTTIKKGEKFVVHGHKKMPSGMGYVMLSRVSQIEDLYISKTFEFDKALTSAASSRFEKEELDKRSIVSLEQSMTFDFFFVNIRSLKNKVSDLKNDRYAMKSKFLMIAETWLDAEQDEQEDNVNENQAIELEGYDHHSAAASRGKGCSLFSKQNESWKLMVKKVDAKFQLISFVVPSKNLQTTLLYVSKGCRLDDLARTMVDIQNLELNQLVIGDFNFDAFENNRLTTQLKDQGMKQLIKRPTHEKGSCIDHVYVSDKTFIDEMKIQSPYYTDHCSICIRLK